MISREEIVKAAEAIRVVLSQRGIIVTDDVLLKAAEEAIKTVRKPYAKLDATIPPWRD